MNPRADVDASGILKVGVSIDDEILKSVPVVPTANVCTEAERVLSEVSPPPAPASLPQKNCPVVVLYRSLLFTASEHPVSPAPVILLEKYPLVVVALMKLDDVAYRRLVVRAEDEALVNVALPVTSKVEDRLRVVPVIAPREE
ncbi:hypothetical protein K9M47_02195, partial [Candidatus Gracilibacteria bacterium]|nr:hypothetical protein [Candidatus Gracilibacteria bacterium]